MAVLHHRGGHQAVTLTFFRRIYRQKIKPLFEAENAQ